MLCYMFLLCFLTIIGKSANVADLRAMFRYLILASAVLFSANALAATSENLIVDRGLFVDQTGTVDITEATRADYRPFTQTLNRSLKKTVRWIRLTVRGPEDISKSIRPAGNSRLEVRLGPHFLYDIAFYEKKGDDWIVQRGGSRYPFFNKQCPEYLYCFNVAVPPTGETSDFYVRLETTNGYYMTSLMMTINEAYSLSTDQNKLIGAMLGIAVVIIFWSTAQYIKSKDPVMGTFVLSQVSSLLFSLSSLGTLARIFFYDAPELDILIFNISLNLRYLTIVIFSYALINQFFAPRWYRVTAFITMAYFVLMLLCVLLGYVWRITLLIDMFILAMLPIVLIYVALRTKKMGPDLKRLLIFGFSCAAILVWADQFGVFRILQSNFYTTPAQLGAFVSGIIMFIFVLKSTKIQRLTLEKTLAEVDVLRAKNQFKLQQLAERSMLIDMLTHELKNPLATLRMAAGSLSRLVSAPTNFDRESGEDRLQSIAQAIISMDGVLERCIQVDQMDQKRFSIRLDYVDVETLVLDMPIVRENRSRLRLNLPDNLIVQLDPQLFSMIATNLIDNALKYSHRTSDIFVSISLGDNVQLNFSKQYLILKVENHAGQSGVPDADQLFTRYYRSTYAHNITGTGLGLYLIRSVCQLLGGSVEYDNQNNLVRFVVRLPV